MQFKKKSTQPKRSGDWRSGKPKIRKLGMAKFASPKAKRPSLLPSPTMELITPTTASARIAASCTSILSSCKTCKKWGLSCPFCAQSALQPSPIDSVWSEEDLDGDIERRKRQEKQRKEEEAKQREWEEEKIPDYDPTSPVCNPDQKKDALPSLSPQEKIELDPNYYPSNYLPKQEDTPTLVNNLVLLVDDNDWKEDRGEEQYKDKEKEHEKKTRLWIKRWQWLLDCTDSDLIY